MLDTVRLLAAEVNLRITAVLALAPWPTPAAPVHDLSALDPMDPAEWSPWADRDKEPDRIPDAHLYLCGQPNVSCTGPLPSWVLCDVEGHSLSASPQLEAISRGQGIALQLLGSSDAPGAWRLLRALHRSAHTDLRRGLSEIAPAIVWLVRQAVADAQLGVWRPADRPAPTAPADPRSLSRHRWRGRLNAWRHRQRARWLAEFWSIGAVDAPVAEWARAHGRLPVRWITRGRLAGHWADPMGLPNDEHRLCCEYMDEHTGIGHIEQLTFDLDSSQAPPRRERLKLGDGSHVSFPLVFEIDGQRVGLIESSARRQCVLYRVDTDAHWTPWHTLLDDVAAADPALFQWEGRYWLAYTDVDIGEHDSLCLYHADQLDGPWQAHANNPVKLDITSSRMAGGFFTMDGADGPMLVRPAQDCLAGYGSGMSLYRVVHCTPTEYHEELIARMIPPEHAPGRDGMHTVSAWGQRTLIDVKRLGLNPWVLWRKLRGRFTGYRHRAVLPDVERLCIYIPHLRLGGGETSLLRLAEGFIRRGLPVDLVVHSLRGAELAVPQGVHVIELGVDGTFSALHRLIGVLRDRRPTWLFSGFPHTNVAAITAVWRARSNTRCVVSEHAPLTRQIEQQSNWRYRVLPPLVRWAYRRADAVVAVSSGVRDDLVSLIGPHLAPVIIHNPVLDEIDQIEAKLASVASVAAPHQLFGDEVPLHAWLSDEDLRVVISVSRLSVEKDVATLIRAFKILHGGHLTTRLLLIGEGPQRNVLQQLIDAEGLSAVAQLVGRVNRPMRWMRRAAVFALASKYEGFGNVLIEALSSGLPVVSTDCPTGPREILADGRYGTLVPVGDAAAMAKALATALAAGGPPAGAVEYANGFTVERACDAYESLFKSLRPEPAC